MLLNTHKVIKYSLSYLITTKENENSKMSNQISSEILDNLGNT